MVNVPWCHDCDNPLGLCSCPDDAVPAYPPQEGGYVGTRRAAKELSPELQELIDRCRTIPFTREMRRAQARSWALGELLLQHDSMSRDEALQIVDSVLDRALWEGPGIEPHEYHPDTMAMGDCSVCGHTYEAHQQVKS